MRLIDADAMISDLLTVDPQFETMIQWCCTVIDAQPTIEERKTGRWIEISESIHTYKCSECGRLLVNITDGKNHVYEHYPYCHCGTRMIGEVDG